MSRHHLLPGRPSLRLFAVCYRNLLVWRKLAVPSLLGNLADPLIYMLGLGYGLGALLPSVAGTSYIHFLAAGTLCYSTMNGATFEALYSGFSRMHVQKTWDAIMNAPLSIDDIVIAEALWAAIKASFSGLAILLVAWALGLIGGAVALWLVPLIALVGFTFGALGLVMTVLAPNYDFFMYYFTLFITPMVLIGGVFFPLAQLPAGIQLLAQCLPLTHAVALARPLLGGSVPDDVGLHLGVLVGYAVFGLLAALVLARRRLLG